MSRVIKGIGVVPLRNELGRLGLRRLLLWNPIAVNLGRFKAINNIPRRNMVRTSGALRLYKRDDIRLIQLVHCPWRIKGNLRAQVNATGRLWALPWVSRLRGPSRLGSL